MGIPSIIQHNFWLKLFSLILATLIWFVVRFSMERDLQLGQKVIPGLDLRESLRVSVSVMTQPGDTRTYKVSPESVIVSVTAEGAVLREISRKNVKAYVDLTDLPANSNGDELVKIHVPTGVSILLVSPLSVRVDQVNP